MESELSEIFQVKLVAKNIVLWCLGTHFMHLRVDIWLILLSLKITMPVKYQR